MSGKKKFLAIIPARSGSKRLPGKNTLPLGGLPLIAWTIEAARKCQIIDDVVVTSDDDSILKIAEQFGVISFLRPRGLAQDNSTSFDVVKNVLENFPSYENVILLQPTSPLRKSFHIAEAINLFETKKADAVVSVTEVDHSPLWCNILPEDGSMENFLSENVLNVRSQDLPTYYRLNGAIYICNGAKLLEERRFLLKKNIYAYRMDAESSVDIDTELDFKLATLLMAEQ